MQTLKNNWEKVLSILEPNLTKASYETWFLKIKPLRLDEAVGKLYLSTTNQMAFNILTSRYIPMLEEAVSEALGHPYSVSISIGNSPKKDVPLNPIFDGEFIFNPRYTFDNFVVGNNNKYAHAASLAVAEAPSESYNPLFLYGASGLGKTHLMHSIGMHIMENYPLLKVLYVSSEMFTNELIKALGEKKMGEFKNKYRKIDVLLIDDIQFIGGKDSTQEEFFHTFNTLYDLNKQIIISSDRPPKELTKIEDRLRSRFQWNIIADISPPDYETRVAILRKKAELANIDIDDELMDVICLISEKVKFNIRELEGAFTRILSFSTLTGEPINLKFAKNILKDIFSSTDFEISPENIKKSVCKHFNIKVSDMESDKRNREFSMPRQIAMYLCREMTDLSFPKIGEVFGNRNYTTVMHGCDKILKDMKTDESLKLTVTKLKTELEGK